MKPILLRRKARTSMPVGPSSYSVWPSITMRPVVGGWIKLIASSKVLLPEPLGPSRATSSPATGRIVIDGQTLYDEGPTGIDVRAFRRSKIGFIFQQHNLIPFLTALENVALMLQINGVSRRESTRRANDLLGTLEIGHRAHSLPAQLSGGEQQRVAIGRALANEPVLLLADEPTAALDTQRGTKVMAMLRSIARERRSAVIAVTHDQRMIEGFDTVYHLEDGRLAQVDHHPQVAAAAPA